MTCHKVNAKLQRSYVWEIDFYDHECTLVCVISEPVLLMVGRAMRYFLRIDSTILQQLFSFLLQPSSSSKSLDSAYASSPIGAPESVNGNKGWTDSPLASVKTLMQGFARFCSLLGLQIQNHNAWKVNGMRDYPCNWYGCSLSALYSWRYRAYRILLNLSDQSAAR